MEDLLKNDATFEITHSSANGMRDCTNWDRTLLSYPSERSSFQVDLGFDGYSNFNTPIPTFTNEQINALKQKEAGANKPKYDPEKVAGAITSGATAIGSIASTVQAFKGDGSKPKSRRKQLKEVCGNKPIFGKDKKKVYNDCVAQYNAGKIGGSTTRMEEAPPTTTETTPSPPPSNNTRNIIIGVVVVGLVVTAFVGYKKGWFGGKPA
jgi:hypothetical protein